VRDGRRSEHTPLSKAVVTVINAYLKAKGWSVHRLSQKVETVSRSQLYLLLNGDAVMDVAELFAICEALGVKPAEVIGLAEKVQSAPPGRSTRVDYTFAVDGTFDLMPVLHDIDAEAGEALPVAARRSRKHPPKGTTDQQPD
jgi:transcriptional regulator with XRE-family HTH domain